LWGQDWQQGSTPISLILTESRGTFGNKKNESMETTENKPIHDTEKVSKGILFCRKLMASKREMQEQARRDWEDPAMRAIFEDLIKKAEDGKK
jgi:hypothetical protein